MKTDQKLRTSSSEKRKKEDKKNIHTIQKFVAVSGHNNKDSKKGQKCFVNVDIVEYRKTVKENEVADYIDLFQSLREIKEEKRYAKKMDTKMVPYEIPELYSLQKDMENLAVIKKRTDVLSKKICRIDIDSMTSDWKKVGKDINEAIYKSKRIHAGESD